MSKLLQEYLQWQILFKNILTILEIDTKFTNIDGKLFVFGKYNRDILFALIDDLNFAIDVVNTCLI